MYPAKLIGTRFLAVGFLPLALLSACQADQGVASPATTIAVSVSPTSTSICTGVIGERGRPVPCPRSMQFTAYVFDDPANAGVVWSAGIGSISPTKSASGVSVTYTAPYGSCGSRSVTARSVADATKSATVSVRLWHRYPVPGC